MSKKLTSKQVLLSAHDTKLRLKERVEIIERYAQQKCEEQKVLCAQQVDKDYIPEQNEFVVVKDGRTTREGAAWLVMEAPFPDFT